MTRTLPLCHNYELKLPGYSRTFLAPQMCFDPMKRTLQVRTDHGNVLFTEEDKIQVLTVDLDIPAFIREQMLEEGWEEMTMGQLVRLLAMDYIS